MARQHPGILCIVIAVQRFAPIIKLTDVRFILQLLYAFRPRIEQFLNILNALLKPRVLPVPERIEDADVFFPFLPRGARLNSAAQRVRAGEVEIGVFLRRQRARIRFSAAGDRARQKDSGQNEGDQFSLLHAYTSSQKSFPASVFRMTCAYARTPKSLG